MLGSPPAELGAAEVYCDGLALLQAVVLCLRLGLAISRVLALLSLPTQAPPGLLQRHRQIESVGSFLKANPQHGLTSLGILDGDGEEAAAVDDGLDGAAVVVGRGGEERAGGRIFEDEVDLDARSSVGAGILVGRLDDAEARGEDVAGGVFGPGGGGVAAHGGQGRDVVDVDGVCDEEDALDGVVGEGLAGCWIDGLHGFVLLFNSMQLVSGEAKRKHRTMLMLMFDVEAGGDAGVGGETAERERRSMGGGGYRGRRCYMSG